ncbi:MAG: hypothetical protein M0015_14850 [Betaproteobacteria bacterium]|nr:hypothetical protein [Betaproteobacteria bacterium]
MKAGSSIIAARADLRTERPENESLRDAPPRPLAWLEVLESDIPIGGLGRPLTPSERCRLGELGIVCTERHIVVRLAVDTPRYGRLYEPTYAPERHAPTAVIVGPANR